MKKGPLSHQKIKCLFLDYVQLLMVGKAIWAKNVDRNAKKWKQPSKSLKNEMFIFGLHSTSDDRLSNLSKKCWQKHKKKQKMPPKISKYKMFIFGLHSTPDDWPSDPSKKHRPKHNKQKRLPKTSKNKMFIFFITFNFWWSAEWSKQKTLTKIQKNGKGPLGHWKMKCSFLDYVQLLMIGRVIWAKNVDQNAKKWKRPPKSLKNQMFISGLCSISDDQPSDLSKKCWPKHKKTKKAP